MMTTERELILAEIEAADLCCPEQVADAVLAELDANGIDAARRELAGAIERDADESRAMGIE